MPRDMKFPNKIVRDNKKQFKRLVVAWRKAINRIVFPEYAKIKQEYQQETRSDSKSKRFDSWISRANTMLNELEIAFDNASERITNYNYFSDVGQRINLWHVKEWRTFLNSALGVTLYKDEPWINNFLIEFADRNVKLVKKLSEDTLSEVERVVKLGVRQGQSIRTMKQALLSQTSLESLNITSLDTTVSVMRKTAQRAELIAVDQVGKFYGELNKERQTQNDIKGYQWITSRDIRVRGNPSGLYPKAKHKHYFRDKKFYLWEPGKAPPGYETEIPTDGSPGIPYRCRCIARPDLRWVEVNQFGALEPNEDFKNAG